MRVRRGKGGGVLECAREYTFPAQLHVLSDVWSPMVGERKERGSAMPRIYTLHNCSSGAWDH